FPDQAVRQSLEYPDHLRSFLRRAVPHLADRFDYDQTKYLGRDFPLDDWRRRESDVLIEIPFRADDGVRLILVCILIEHQSEPDPLMPLRTLIYAVLYWDRMWRTWEESPKPRPAFKLPPVLQLVLHTAPYRWRSN